MRYEYIFYLTDDSFDYGDWSWGGTYYCSGKHGFSIEISPDNIPDIDSLEGFGAFDGIREEVHNSQELIEYIEHNSEEIQEWAEESGLSNRERFEELVELLKQERVEK